MKSAGAVLAKGTGVRSGLAGQEIREQLERILTSESFVRAERLSRFLRFVVEEAMDGRQDHLKEYSIGITVFDKSADFDPRIDPIVRVEAGRLRAKIREYYDTVGKDDPIWIGLRSRGYRPVLRPNGPTSSAPAAQPSGKRLPAAAAAAEPEPQPAPAAEQRSRSVAVLPFQDLSPEKNQQYFCDALAQQIVNSLANVNGLRVVARTSAAQFKGQAKDVREIGKQLKADYILEGSVQKIGKQIRVHAHLVDAATGYDSWADTYDRPLENIFALQDEVSTAITCGLDSKLQSPCGEVPSSGHNAKNSAAYQQYLKALHHWDQRSDEHIRRAIRHFQQATRKDPHYAKAYGGLASAYISLAISGGMAPKNAMTRARAAAEKGLEIDGGQGEALAALATVKALYERDWSNAEATFLKATQNDPRFPVACHWRALAYLLPLGDLDAALGQLQSAREGDPTSVIINTHLGLLLYMRREYDRAIEQLQFVIELEPGFYRAYWDLGRAYVQKNMLTDARECYEKARGLEGGAAFRLGALGHLYALNGDRQKALGLVEELQRLANERYVPPSNFAEIFVGLNDPDAAFSWLERAVRDRTPWVCWIGADPVFDPIRSDARFDALLVRMGLHKAETASEPSTSKTRKAVAVSR